MTVAIATAYFVAFIVLHIAVALLSRRLDATPPRRSIARVRLARQIGLLLIGKAVWFAVLFGVAAATVVAATPALPLIEVILVYGGIIGIVTSLMQAADWFTTARGIRTAAAAVDALTIGAGGLVEERELVSVRLPRDVLDRLRRDGQLEEADVVLTTEND